MGYLNSAGSVGPLGQHLDSSAIINTLAGGGVSTVGDATEMLANEKRGLLDRFKSDDGMFADTANSTNRITGLIRKAALGRLTLPCEIDGGERALVVVGVRLRTLIGKALSAAENGSRADR